MQIQWSCGLWKKLLVEKLLTNRVKELNTHSGHWNLGLQSYVSEWVQYPNASIRNQRHQRLDHYFIMYIKVSCSRAGRAILYIYILEIFGGSCSIYIYYMYIIICISSASIPVLTSSSTSCWNPFCNCGLGAGTKKNWRNMWQMYTNVTKLMHIDENKTLSNSGQIKHI